MILLTAPVGLIRQSALNVKVVRYRGLSVNQQGDLHSVGFKSQVSRRQD